MMQPQRKAYKYYDLLMAAFVTILICSNFIGSSKAATLFGYSFSGSVLFFPISYIFGDVLTEVYGYARARRVVWAGFSCMLAATLLSLLILYLPPAPEWPDQAAYEKIFGVTPRIALASMVAFFVGEFVNSYVMAKLKVKTAGRFLWFRTVSSTIFGEAVDSLVFYPLAFLGVWESSLVWKVMLTNYTLKVGWEVINTPIVYRVVAFLKREEKEDFYDVETNFTPFSIKA